MWDEHLSYDDPQAVLDYINKERHSTSTGREGPSVSSSKQSLAIYSSTSLSTDEEQEQSVTSDICPSNLFIGKGEEQSEQTADNQTDDENQTANHDSLNFLESISQSFHNINNVDGEVRETSSSTRMIGISSEGDLATTSTVEMTFDNETIQTPPRLCTQENHHAHYPSRVHHHHHHQHRKNDAMMGAPQRNRYETTANNSLGFSITAADAIIDDDHESSSHKHCPSHVKSSRLDIAEKLDIVADLDNLPDAIFALTEWIRKAAKPNEVSQIKNLIPHRRRVACPMTYILQLTKFFGVCLTPLILFLHHVVLFKSWMHCVRHK